MKKRGCVKNRSVTGSLLEVKGRWLAKRGKAPGGASGLGTVMLRSLNGENYAINPDCGDCSKYEQIRDSGRGREPVGCSLSP